MKKTLTVNLGGTVFHIDEDAYRLLDNYLSNLKIHFRKEAGADEIIDDIERRISELFTEKLVAGSQVITIAYVEEVIARMGKPNWSLTQEMPIPEAAVGTAATMPAIQVQALPQLRRKCLTISIAIPTIRCWAVW